MTAHEASSSSSSKSKLWKYDVFLSFSGEDTRNGFTGHLHSALKDKGYQAFFDEDDLKRGEEIKEELFQAIEESRISIIVFSKRYADSSWCLDELVRIMECRDKLGRYVLPIFYHVDPSHVRKQDGDLDEAFQKHEKDICAEIDDKKREAKQERVKQWRKALTKAANLSGHPLKITNNRKQRREALTEAAYLSDHQTTDNGREAKFIRKIVDENIWEWLTSTNELHVAKHQVGIDSRIQDIITYLSSGGSNDVLMVGIWGMGGLGKTTAAKAIYNQIHPMFQFKSFLADVSDTIGKHGLVYLQKKLISDIMKQKSRISSVDGGISMIKQNLRRRRVLVIMDNIDEVGQLNAIAGNHDWFGPGSRIIITTRDEHLLRKLEVNKTYPLHEMNEVEALELFSWHAFGNSWPNEGYLELSKKVVSYCGGLPLALEVLGSFFTKRTIAEWKSQLEKLERTPDEKITKPLRISFEGLDDIQKAIFLDISCFFIGKDKDYVAKVLDGCGFSTTIEISVLRERCLVTVENNELNMHDLLREMAGGIISEKSPGHPEKWSRLWNPREVTDVLTNKSGTEEVEGVALHLPCPDGRSIFSTVAFDNKMKLGLLYQLLHHVVHKGWFKNLVSLVFPYTVHHRTEEVEGVALHLPYPNESSFSTMAFAKMKKLRLLQLSYVELNGEYRHLPKELIWFCWLGCPLQSIPDDFFNQPRLVVLEMKFSNLVQVWEGSKSLQKLKIIDLSHSHFLIKSPDVSQLPNLEELILEDCIRLREIHPSIAHLKRLSLVNLTNCSNLISLPRDFYKSKSVETLCLNDCSEFIELHEDLGEMISLRILEAKYTAITEVPPSLVRLKNLTRLSLEGVKSIHLYSLHGLNSLRELNLSWCKLADDAIPKDLGSLISLQDLNLQGNKLHTLPNLSGLSKLETLRLNKCFNLHTIPDLPTNLKFLYAFHLPALETMPNFSEMSNMRELNVSDSPKLTEVPGLDKSLNSMTMIDMQGCTKLTTDFTKTILQGWTSCGFGGIYLHGNYVPDWFKFVNDGNKVSFDIPPSDDRNFEGLTLFCLYHSCNEIDHCFPVDVTVINNTKRTELRACIGIADWEEQKFEDHFLRQGQLSNDKLKLQGGDKIDILFEVTQVRYYHAIMKRTEVNMKRAGVDLVWDKPMKENMHDLDKAGYVFDPRPTRFNDEAGPSHEAFDNNHPDNQMRITENAKNGKRQEI